MDCTRRRYIRASLATSIAKTARRGAAAFFYQILTASWLRDVCSNSKVPNVDDADGPVFALLQNRSHVDVAMNS